MGKEVDVKVPEIIGYRDLLAKKVTFGCSTVMIDREIIPDVRMPLMRTGQDYATWLSILKQGHTAYLLLQTLSSYRILPNSVSRNKFRKAIRQWSIYRDVERLSVLESAFYFSSYAYRAIFRK